MTTTPNGAWMMISGAFLTVPADKRSDFAMRCVELSMQFVERSRPTAAPAPERAPSCVRRHGFRVIEGGMR